MTFDDGKAFDATDYRILAELQCDGRLTMAELGRRIALSPPAAAERVRRLEQMGVITGYAARIDPARLGLGVLALVRVAAFDSPADSTRRLRQAVSALPEVIECHHITGEDCYMLKLVARDMKALEALIENLALFGRTTTSIVLSSPVTSRPFLPEAPSGTR